MLPLRLVDQLEQDRPQVSIWPVFQLFPVCQTFRHVPRVNWNLDVGLSVDTIEDSDGSQSSARGTVCLPGTWPPEKPMRCSSKDVSLSDCKEKVATPNATCLSFWECRGCLLIRRRRPTNCSWRIRRNRCFSESATFCVNASRVLPPLTITNVKNPCIFILVLLPLEPETHDNVVDDGRDDEER